jgi:hypothetical protein
MITKSYSILIGAGKNSCDEYTHTGVEYLFQDDAEKRGR